MSAISESSVHQSGASPQMIRLDEALEKILSSPSFSSSRQAQQLLRYLVEKSSQDNDCSLKERTIGIEVFGRKPDYNTGDDPIVRARIGDLRKRLAHYYLNEEAGHERIQLSIPPGSYRVIYRLIDAVRPAPEPTLRPSNTNLASNGDQVLPSSDSVHADARPPSGPVRLPQRKLVFALIGSAVIAVLTLTFVVRGHLAQSNTAIDQFWAPMSHESKHVLIYVGTNAVYAPISGQPHRDLATHSNFILPPVTKDITLGPKDIFAVNHEFTTSGDLLASVRITTYLNGRNIGYDLRIGDNITIDELRHSPTILIGCSSNFWAEEMFQYLPIEYVFGVGFKDVKNNTAWNEDIFYDRKRGESFAIAARIWDPASGEPVIMAAGLSSLGTTMASQFITDPTALRTLASAAPPGWEKKNMEVLLRTQVLEGDTGAPIVVAVRYW